MRKIESKETRKKNRRRNILLNCAMVICAAVAVVSAGMLIASYLEYKQGDALMEGIAQYAGFTGEDTEGQEGEAAALTVDFDALLAINPDFVGWLYSEGTVINYPVVQGEDNDYYLTHVFDGQEHKYGSIFLDKNTQADFTDTNTLIHGHRMNSGAMFGTLPEYAKQEYFEQHKVLMLYTPSKNYRLEVFAAYEVPANTQSVPLNFSDMAEYREYLDAAAEKSLIRSDVSVSTEDQIVTLSTCTRTDSQKRFIVQAKLVPVS